MLKKVESSLVWDLNVPISVAPLEQELILVSVVAVPKSNQEKDTVPVTESGPSPIAIFTKNC